MTEVYWRTAMQAGSGFGAAGSGFRVSAAPLPRRVDVAVVGAGFAGLSIALDLVRAAPGLSVAVLEARHVGYGASGRNAGLVLPLVLPWLLARSAGGHDHRDLQRRFHARATDRVRRLRSAHPAAQARPVRVLLIGGNRVGAAGLGWAGDAIHAAGVGVERWSGEQVAAACGAPADGAVVLDGWTVQPAALAASLAARLVAAGGAVHEGVRVAAVTPVGDGVRIAHDRGSIVADRVVVCAGAYTGGIAVPDQPPGRPVHTYMRASGPMSGPAAAEFGGDGLFMAAPGVGMAYWRVQDGRLLFGGTDIGGLPPGSAADALPRAHRGLDRLMRRRLPAAAGLPVTHRWGGAMHVTRSEMPYLARSAASDRLVYAVGFGGSGVAFTLTCGPLVRDLVLGRAAADPEAVHLRRAVRATTIAWSSLLAVAPSAAAHLLRGLAPAGR